MPEWPGQTSHHPDGPVGLRPSAEILHQAIDLILGHAIPSSRMAAANALARSQASTVASGCGA